MRVDDVGTAPSPLLVQVGGEVVHVGEKFVFRNESGGTGTHMVHLDAFPAPDAARQVGVVPAGVHDDVDLPAGQGIGQRGDVDVLPARVDTAECRERAGMLGNHRDLRRDLRRDLHQGASRTSCRAGGTVTTGKARTVSTASTTSSGSTVFRQGWPGTGQSRARHPAQPIAWSPSRTCREV